ncbi:MAG: L,D-transpeptidase family protein [Beijerinckiaceae bacterium]
MNFKARIDRIGSFAILSALCAGLAACSDDLGGGVSRRAYQPLSSEVLALMQEKGTTQNAPVLIRTYKKEAEFEVWKMAADGRYVLLKTYPMCRWSGQLGPKTREGDRQVPEGFYAITPGQMNPNSAYYLSFNVGYPNAYDRAHGYGGGSIMVHGACSSAGCFSMTDQEIAEIYSLARDGFLGGQRAIQMQSLPFHMTAENFAKYRLDPNVAFWKELKVGTDNFEVTRQDVAVGVCNNHYVFNAKPVDGSQLDPTGACPPLKQDDRIHAEVAAKEKQDASKIAELVAQGARAVHTVYADGGQNPAFASRYIFGLSRPEALAKGPVDVALDDGKAKKLSPAEQIAAAKAKQQEKLATSDPAVAAAAPQPEPPQNAVSLISNLWAAQHGTQPAAPVAAYEPAEPQPADVPLPPRRLQAFAMKPVSPVVDQQ